MAILMAEKGLKMKDSFDLKLAKGLFCSVGRIGYKEEGLRLTFGDAIPYNLVFEVQLARSDIIPLIKLLQKALKEEKNLPL